MAEYRIEFMGTDYYDIIFSVQQPVYEMVNGQRVESYTTDTYRISRKSFNHLIDTLAHDEINNEYGSYNSTSIMTDSFRHLIRDLIREYISSGEGRWIIDSQIENHRK